MAGKNPISRAKPSNIATGDLHTPRVGFINTLLLEVSYLHWHMVESPAFSFTFRA